MKMRFTLTLITVLFLPGCLMMFNSFDLSPDIEPLEESVLMGEGRNKIALIDISGDILDEAETDLLGLTVEESMVALLYDQLTMIQETKNIKAVIIRINSPGGSVTASDLLYQQVAQFKEEAQIPIYSIMMDVAASGGYYLAMATDKIYAHPTTITGSIGVIMFNLSFEGLMKKVGVKSKIIKSGKNKDIGSPLKDLSPEERRILQSIIDDLYNRFVEVVVKGRPELSKENILNLADGRVYTADQAKRVGLIDAVGFLPNIIGDIQKELGLEKAKVVVYKRPSTQMSNIYSRMDRIQPRAFNLIDPDLLKPLTRSQTSPGFYYLWDPAVH